MTKLYLTKTEALERYPLDPDELEGLIREERVTYVTVADQGQEILGVYDDDLAAYVAERDITPEKFKHLRGNLLNLNQASLEYKLTSSTLSRWVQQGVIEVKKEEGVEKFVDEADVAYIAALAKAKKIRKGKKLFG